jgi:hypothetical protein
LISYCIKTTLVPHATLTSETPLTRKSMTASDMTFNEEDVSSWTYESVKSYVHGSSPRLLKTFFLNFFDWSEDDYVKSRKLTCLEVKKYFDPTKKFPFNGPQAESRHTVQMNLVQDWPNLFVSRHGPDPPAWFDDELISRPPSSSDPRPFDMKNVVQQFISFTRKAVPVSDRPGRRLKRNGRAENHAHNDEEDEDGCRALNKRPRTSWLGSTTILPNTSPTNMRPSLHTMNPRSQANVDAKQPNMGLTSHTYENTYSQVISASGDKKKATNPLGLILYITRVTIIDQALILERDRFGLVENLFERGRLVESYFQELVFGNPLYNKPTFLWFFDDSSEDKPRSINNRPSAEVAISILRDRAEKAGASGIQLFDAPDSDTAALVPVHEVTRKQDFVQRVSFELEIDKGEVDDDDNDMEEAEKASRVDSGYGSRDGELQLDDVTVKEEIESKPNITWAGQQQENKVESESESESDEDEDIGSFYR